MKISIPTVVFLVCTALFLSQCNRTVYTKSNFPEKRISFGSGGGITGAVTTYHLLPNGQVFVSDGLMADTVAMLTVKKKEAKSLFELADNAFLDTLDYNHPENRYQFLHYYNEKKEERVVWGAKEGQVPEAVNHLYMVLKKKLNPSDKLK